MAYLDNDNTASEQAYNEKLVGKLNNYREEAATKNAGKQISKKLLNSLNEARRTQRMLVGESTVYKAPAAPEPPEPAPESSTVDNKLMADQHDYINQLTAHETEEDFDMEASFDEVAQKMRDNADNEETITEEDIN